MPNKVVKKKKININYESALEMLSEIALLELLKLQARKEIRDENEKRLYTNTKYSH